MPKNHEIFRPMTTLSMSVNAQEFHKLLADHSEALKFVREMSIQPCPHWCHDDCLKCRTKAWLHETGKASA